MFEMRSVASLGMRCRSVRHTRNGVIRVRTRDDCNQSGLETYHGCGINRARFLPANDAG